MLGVEFGDELSIELSFLVIALNLSLQRDGISGVRETVLTHRTLGVVFEPDEIGFDALSAALREREDDLGALRELPSRVVTIPVWYGDPWSRECALAHGVGDNLEYLAQVNGMTTGEVVEAHSSVEHWVSAVGFQPGTYQAIPIASDFGLTAPKYERPRKSTPDRTLCIAGQITSFYPVESPGGYQLLGRTPIDLYDPAQHNAVFADSPVLSMVGERHRYVPIDEDAYRALRAEVEANTYTYEIEDGVFRLPEVAA